MTTNFYLFINHSIYLSVFLQRSPQITTIFSGDVHVLPAWVSTVG